MFSKKQQPQEPEMIELKELSSTGVETSDVKSNGRCHGSYDEQSSFRVAGGVISRDQVAAQVI